MATDNSRKVQFNLNSGANEVENRQGMDSSKVCQFCKQTESRYTCPKCNCYYCGLSCYKSKDHAECSESFYKENVLMELKGIKATSPLKKQTVEMLRRIEKDNRSCTSLSWDDDEAVESLEARMSSLELDEASFEEIFERLTKKERKLFDDIVSNGEIELTELVTPWWIENCYKGIEEVNHVTKVTLESHTTPKPLPKIKPLRDLLPDKEPSPCIPLNICEVIVVYSYAYRLYNGDLYSSTQEALGTILELSPVLKDNYNNTSLGCCLNLFVQRVKSLLSLKDALDPVGDPFNDLIVIISSYSRAEQGNTETKLVPSSVLCISDLHDLFTSAILELERLRDKSKEGRQVKKVYQRTAKKLYFLISWLVENHQGFSHFKERIKAVKSKIVTYWENVKEDKQQIEEFIHEKKDNVKKRLIEEI